ncbi:hypothetical protein CGCSCA4_v012429 [Colletotrichum siamense]|uniref:SnoaL-like domain-containing protein n=1 Tax=Colletotrichum siamense TaxID=690259 RepID=A0A9P5EEL2_COLSI|nr:hypothetical protein CGCSCA4_v012429 [Colletotrichum siamense]KAF4850123.1 hypothetical protein CGCSCA2_v011411 [Colletotrichum siamense]
MATNDLASFKIYLKAYGDAEYDKVGSYYHEDVSILLPDKQFVSGRVNFLEHLRRTHTLFTETLSIRTIILQGDRSFVVMDAFFEAKQDAPPEAVGGKSFQKDEMAHFVVWALYQWSEGKIQNIECIMRDATFFEPGSTTIATLVEQSRRMADKGVAL